MSSTTTLNPPVTVLDATPTAPPQPNSFQERPPLGLWIMLGSLLALLLTVSAVLYLASQMSR
jgi:hypothetical protein